MTQHIEAIYESGILRPLEPLALPEHSCVLLDVRPADSDALPPATAEELAYQQAAVAALAASLAQLPVHNPNHGWDSSRVDEILYGWKK